MTSATAEAFASLVLVSLAISAAAGLIGLVAILFLRRASTVFLRTTLRLAQRGLAPSAQSYLQEWILSWEADLRQEAEDQKIGELRREMFLLARISTLPIHVATLRTEARRHSRPAAIPGKNRGNYYGRTLRDGEALYFDMNPGFREMQVWSETSGQIVNILDFSETQKERGDTLVGIMNLLTERASTDWPELVNDLIHIGIPIRLRYDAVLPDDPHLTHCAVHAH